MSDERRNHGQEIAAIFEQAAETQAEARCRGDGGLTLDDRLEPEQAPAPARRRARE